MQTKIVERSKVKLVGIKIKRAGSDKWEDLGLIWKIKQFFFELRNRIFGLGLADVFTSVGEEWQVDIIDGTLSPTAHYIGWGTGAGTHTKASTALFTEASEARVTATKSQPTADKNRWVGTLTANAAKTITNAGVFTASTGGILLLASDFTGIVLSLGDSIQFTWDKEVT